IRAARNARRGEEIRIVGSVVEASRSRSVTIADAADDALCLSDPIPDHRQESAHVADMVVRGGAVPHALQLGFIMISAQQLVQEPLHDEPLPSIEPLYSGIDPLLLCRELVSAALIKPLSEVFEFFWNQHDILAPPCTG